MKTCIFVAIALCITVCLADTVFARPEKSDGAFTSNVNIEQLEPETYIRQKRATCDLLSADKLGLNHSACAAHCLVKGYRGGYCNGQAVCVCRN